jgi:hypothetical protein
MSKIVLTCVACGMTEIIDDTPELIRDRKCKACGESLVVKRPPGDTSSAPLPKEAEEHDQSGY